MVARLLSRRVLVNALAVGAVGLLLAIAMQASRVLAPLAAARASSVEIALALSAVAVLAAPFVIVIAAGLASAIAVTSLATDGARDGLAAHGVGPARATWSIVPAAITLALVALVAAAVLEPIAARVVVDRAEDLAVRAVRAALDEGRVLPFGATGALAMIPSDGARTSSTRAPTLAIASGPDRAGDVATLRASLVALRFPTEARLGRGVVSLVREGRSVTLSFARARWPLGDDALAGAPRAATRSVVPDRRLARSTLDALFAARTGDGDALALVARRSLPAVLALLACVAPFAIGWSRRRPGLGLVLACGVAPAVLALGTARALSDACPAGLAELLALAVFALAVAPSAVLSRRQRATRRVKST